MGLSAVIWNGVSCYTLPQPECGFVCGPGNTCPSEYACASTGVCVLTGSTMHCVADGGADALDANLAPPLVTSTNPINGQPMAPRSTPISATFDEDVSPFDSTTFVVRVAGIPLPGTYSYDAPSMTASFMPDPALPPGVFVSVELTSGISNDLHVPLGDYTWSFVTIDDVAPALATSMPMNMDIDVDPMTQITVTFTEPVVNVDDTSFTVFQGATQIPGTISGSDTIDFTFTPSAALPSASVITVNLSGAIMDFANNALVPVSFSFTTM